MILSRLKINDQPFGLEILQGMTLKVVPQDLGEVLRSEDGDVIMITQSQKLSVTLEGSGEKMPDIPDLVKGGKFQIHLPSPLWTESRTPSRQYSRLFRSGEHFGYLALLDTLLVDFEMKINPSERPLSFKFVFEEV